MERNILQYSDRDLNELEALIRNLTTHYLKKKSESLRLTKIGNFPLLDEIANRIITRNFNAILRKASFEEEKVENNPINYLYPPPLRQ